MVSTQGEYPEVPMSPQHANDLPDGEAPDLYAPGHLGELTQVIDPVLVDAIVEETGAREQRTRLLPARVMVYFTLALALFEHSSYQATWSKLTAGLPAPATASPRTSSLTRARRRLGTAPLHRLFTTVAGPVAGPDQPDSFYHGLRLVAVDGTTLSAPDQAADTGHYHKPLAATGPCAYPLVRLVALVECGTRALLHAVFGPDDRSEMSCARDLLDHLDPSMLLLADAYYEGYDFLRTTAATGASFLIRATRKRRPRIRRRLPDGSSLITVHGHRRAKDGPTMHLRLIEAWTTVTLADGTRRTELWRLLTTLLDAERHPARQLVDLYHQRWQVETCYFSLKSTILDGHVLRSRSVPGIAQEVYALLTVYQALIRIGGDVTTARPGLSAHRLSFAVLLHAAADQVVAARGIDPDGPVPLIGAIGQAALNNLLPQHHRLRIKARYRKTRSKYHFKSRDHPRTTQTYTLHIQVITAHDLDNTAPD